MDYKEKFYDALAAMLRKKFSLDVVKVTNFEDYTRSGGFCSTCSYTETRCIISYVDSDGKDCEYDYFSSFAELMNNL